MLAQLGCHGQMGQCYTSSRSHAAAYDLQLLYHTIHMYLRIVCLFRTMLGVIRSLSSHSVGHRTTGRDLSCCARIYLHTWRRVYGTYPTHIPDLPNSKNVQGKARLLTSIGYTVQLYVDGGCAEMNATVPRGQSCPLSVVVQGGRS